MEAANDMPRKRELPISREIKMLRTEVTHALGEAIIREWPRRTIIKILSCLALGNTGFRELVRKWAVFHLS
jgi:hypothetical protein